jgi:N-methylhydantoinase A/oxoprolinase/acetone carboxylase beta subunit
MSVVSIPLCYERAQCQLPNAGTNTDAALLDPAISGPEAVITSYKATTGTDLTTGIEEAIRVLLKNANVSPASVASLMVGTTVSCCHA